MASILFVFLFVVGSTPSANALIYFEAGTSAGSIKNGDAFFDRPGTTTQGVGFATSLSAYYSTKNLIPGTHFDFGIQNRLIGGTIQPGTQAYWLSPNIAARFEIWRFFVGGGYSPFHYTGVGGISNLRGIANRTSFFLEIGAIWRVIPELQIVVAAGRDVGFTPGAISSVTTGEYGLRFRFPFNPKDDSGNQGVQWDGIRYPFGIMRD